MTRHGRFAWPVLGGILLLLALFSLRELDSEFEMDLVQSRQTADLQLQLISAMVTTELSLGNYQDVSTLFSSHASADRHLVTLKLVSANGFQLAFVQNSTFPAHLLTLEKTITYSYRREATVTLTTSLDDVYQARDHALEFFSSLFAIFSLLSSLMLYFALKSSRESQKAARLSRLYKSLSEINQAIVRMEKEELLFPLVCRCAVEFGGMRMAWIAQVSESTGLFHPAAQYGQGLDYLSDIVVSSSPDLPEGQGPIAIAFRENRHYVINDYFRTTLTQPWASQVSDQNWRSAAAFPITREGKPYAVLSVYHDQGHAFDAEAIALLDEMSKDVSFALDNFDRELRKRKAEDSLKMAASIYENSNEGMMIIDADHLILSVNPAFTIITGYSLKEVKGKTFLIFKSDRHDSGFYQALWKEVNTTGKWVGEIWERRKNGEVYPKWLTINTVLDDQGNVHHRVAMFTDISQRKKSDEIIWRQANIDHLTELPNRRLFLDRLVQETRKIHRTEKSLALFFIDLDRFKEINDSLGHAKGDTLLIETARRINGCVRETDTVARMGGDEFTLIVPEFGDKVQLERIAQDILKSLSKPYDLGDSNLVTYATASIGIALYPDDARDMDELMRHADQAMYAAKASGRNRCNYFTPSMQLEAREKMQLVNDLRFALAHREFEIHYQPIIDLTNGNIDKMEALLRWTHPERGPISPAIFIPLAEEFGMIHSIGDWVLVQSTAIVADWHVRFGRTIQVSVNRSPIEFERESSNWSDILSVSGLPDNCITMEITEGLLLKESEKIHRTLLEFRNRGIEVSIDDFGTGFSALSYLKQFDIDYLKIDRSFVRNLTESASDKALVEAIIVMAHKLGIRTIAEGVETLEQQNLLVSFGCDYAQGFLYSRPVPAKDFELLLAAH